MIYGAAVNRTRVLATPMLGDTNYTTAPDSKGSDKLV